MMLNNKHKLKLFQNYYQNSDQSRNNEIPNILSLSLFCPWICNPNHAKIQFPTSSMSKIYLKWKHNIDRWAPRSKREFEN